MTDLIIGMGEIGTALYECYLDKKQVIGYDIKSPKEIKGSIDCMHIAFPFDDEFNEEVIKYAILYKPRIIIIHSTVPVGTTRGLYDKLKIPIAHSPCVGKHPELKESIQERFVKIFSVIPDTEELNVKSIFISKMGIDNVNSFKLPEATELAKVLETTEYLWHILIATEYQRLCKEYRVDFDEVYRYYRLSYNSGYERKYTRPVLEPHTGHIGGHCIIPNLKILEKYMKPTWFTEVRL